MSQHVSNVDESAVSLKFWGNSLVPEIVTESLGLEPHLAFAKGECLSTDTSLVQPTGVWMYWMERSEAELEAQILVLLKRFPQELDIWQRLSASFSSGLFCGLWLHQPEAQQSLSAPTLLHITQRGLSLHSQIYFEPMDK